jgi:hypothetical protein
MHHICFKNIWHLCVKNMNSWKNDFHTISIIKLCDGKFVMMVIMHDIQKVQLNSNLNMLWWWYHHHHMSWVHWAIIYNLPRFLNNKQNKEQKFVGIMGLMWECYKLVLSLIQKINKMNNNLIFPHQLQILIILVKTNKSIIFV